jgi:hypothetical protein
MPQMRFMELDGESAMLSVLLWGMIAASVNGAAPGSLDVHLVEIKPLVVAPSDRSQWDSWRAELAAARQQMRQRLNYDGGLYRREEFAWVPSCYSCCFVMMCDQRFYDPVSRRYTIEAYLDEGRAEFGGYDAVVLWHAYPRIGFDDRNQFDFYRDMPGGLAGLRELSRTLRERGVKIFINYNPGTPGPAGRPGLTSRCWPNLSRPSRPMAYSSIRFMRQCGNCATGWTPCVRAWSWNRN